MLKPFLIVSAAILFVFLAAPVTEGISQETPSGPGAPASTNPVKPTAATREKAKGLYARDCALCHGDDGNGKTDVASSMQVKLADWTDAKTLANKSDQELYDIIRKGKGENMPSEDAGRAKNDEVWGLVTYLRSLAKSQSAPTPAAPDQPATAPPAPEQPATTAPPPDQPAPAETAPAQPAPPPTN